MTTPPPKKCIPARGQEDEDKKGKLALSVKEEEERERERGVRWGRRHGGTAGESVNGVCGVLMLNEEDVCFEGILFLRRKKGEGGVERRYGMADARCVDLLVDSAEETCVVVLDVPS